MTQNFKSKIIDSTHIKEALTNVVQNGTTVVERIFMYTEKNGMEDMIIHEMNIENYICWIVCQKSEINKWIVSFANPYDIKSFILPNGMTNVELTALLADVSNNHLNTIIILGLVNSGFRIETTNQITQKSEIAQDNFWSFLVSKNFWITLIVIYLIWLAYDMGKSENQGLTPQEEQKAINDCQRWGGSVIYNNGVYQDCAINGRIQ